MIFENWYKQQLEELIGKHIFHSSKGKIPFFGVNSANLSVGKYLGKVDEVTGPNRIYYVEADGNRKYVSLSGIGIVCESREEKDKLIALKDDSFDMYNKAMNEVANFIEKEVAKI